MMMPFEWDVRVSSKEHTVTALTSYDKPDTVGYTTIRGTTSSSMVLGKCRSHVMVFEAIRGGRSVEFLLFFDMILISNVVPP